MPYIYPLLIDRQLTYYYKISDSLLVFRAMLFGHTSLINNTYILNRYGTYDGF